MVNLKLLKIYGMLKIWHIFFFIILILLKFNSVNCFNVNFDNYVSIKLRDCYTRVSIGFRLIESLVISTKPSVSISDCEATCSANGTSCGSFSFGVGARGNTTCLFGKGIPRQPEDLQVDPDYDIYLKGRLSLRGCQPIRSPSSSSSSPTITTTTTTTTAPTLSINNVNQTSTDFTTNQVQNDTNNNVDNNSALIINDNSQRVFGNTSFLNILRSSILTRSKTRNNNNNTIQYNPNEPLKNVIFSPEPADDDKIRTSDILKNQDIHYNDDDNYPIIENENIPFEYHYIDHGNYWLPTIENNQFGKKLNSYSLPIHSTIEPTIIYNDNYDNDIIKNLEFYPSFGDKIITPVDFEVQVNNPWLYMSDDKRPSLNEQSSVFDLSELDLTNEKKVIIVQDADCDDSCFRRLFSGKKLIDGYVRKTLDCNKLHDCHRMCEYERGFTCEGFNYRSHPKGICELTSISPSRMNINRDFINDSQFDFYERDWIKPRCSQNRQKYPKSQNWWQQEQRPGWQYSDRPRNSYGPSSSSASSSSFSNQNHGIIPYGMRPVNYGYQRPTISSYNHGDPWNSVVNQDSRLPLPVRPIENDYPSGPSSIQRPFGSSRRPDDYGYIADRLAPNHGYERLPQYYPPRPGYNDRIVYSDNGYSYGHKYPPFGYQYQTKYQHRRVGYGPDSDTNEVTPHYSIDQRKPLKPNYCNSCRIYPTDINHDNQNHIDNKKNYYDTITNDDKQQLYHSKLSTNLKHHEQTSGYGGGFGYSDQTKLPPKVIPILSDKRECSIRSIGGYRLARGMIRKSYLTSNLEQCESLCQNQKELICRTFAYRYNLAPTSPADNCLLSDAIFENLIYYTDLEPDRDYDIYSMNNNSKWCENRRSSMIENNQHPPDECFWRIRSGFSMPSSIVVKSIRVDGMGECQVECVTSKDFTCRSFIFKYDTYYTNDLTSSNCYLSDCPAMEIDPNKMEDMDGAELYERGSFGRGCEPHLPIPQSINQIQNNLRQYNHKSMNFDEASCYAGYERPCKLTPYAIILTTTVHNEADCRRKCSIMRIDNSIPCMSYSYKINNNHQDDNCYLSDVPTRDLRSGLDYIHDKDFVFYVWKELDPRCSQIQSSSFNQRKDLLPSIGYIPPINNNQKPYVKTDEPYFNVALTVPEPNRPASQINQISIDNSQNTVDYVEKFIFNLPDEFSVFRRYTVTGKRCKIGTICEKNKIGGFWSCEPEGAELGSWDYCCEPNHQCGFSQGFSYLWCYVGTSPEQWRPCSETYDPNFEKPRPINPSRPRVEDNEKNNYLRHWPIAFLHHESPPNGTDSIALANDVNNHHHNLTNETTTTTTTVVIEHNVVPIEKNNSNNNLINTTTITTHIQRRGTKKSDENNQLTVVPIKLTSTTEKNKIINLSSNQNSSNKNNNYSTRFSRDENGQYFITKRLNAGLPTQDKDLKLSQIQEEDKKNNNKGFIAKIEKITKINDSNIKNNNNDLSINQRTVTINLPQQQLTTNNSTIIVPSVSFAIENSSTIIPKIIKSNNNKYWEKIDVIEKSYD